MYAVASGNAGETDIRSNKKRSGRTERGLGRERSKAHQRACGGEEVEETGQSETAGLRRRLRELEAMLAQVRSEQADVSE